MPPRAPRGLNLRTLQEGLQLGLETGNWSQLGEEINPLNPSLSYALSSFDIRHNFVASYKYKLPVERLLGWNRWTEHLDIALLKRVRLTEPKSLQFRIEGFNAFNHAQFFGPDTVDGEINSSTFGQVTNADPPRLVQISAKLFF